MSGWPLRDSSHEKKFAGLGPKPGSSVISSLCPHPLSPLAPVSSTCCPLHYFNAVLKALDLNEENEKALWFEGFKSGKKKATVRQNLLGGGEGSAECQETRVHSLQISKVFRIDDLKILSQASLNKSQFGLAFCSSSFFHLDNFGFFQLVKDKITLITSNNFTPLWHLHVN